MEEVSNVRDRGRPGARRQSQNDQDVLVCSTAHARLSLLVVGLLYGLFYLVRDPPAAVANPDHAGVDEKRDLDFQHYQCRRDDRHALYFRSGVWQIRCPNSHGRDLVFCCHPVSRVLFLSFVYYPLDVWFRSISVPPLCPCSTDAPILSGFCHPLFFYNIELHASD